MQYGYQPNWSMLIYNKKTEKAVRYMAGTTTLEVYLRLSSFLFVISKMVFKNYCAFYYCVPKLTVFPEAVCCRKGNPLTRQRVWSHRYIVYTAATIDNHFLPHHLPLLVAVLTSLQASWRSTQFPSIILTSTSPITSTIDSRPRGCEPYLYPTTEESAEWDQIMGPWFINTLLAFSRHLHRTATATGTVFHGSALEKEFLKMQSKFLTRYWAQVQVSFRYISNLFRAKVQNMSKQQ